MENKLIKKQNKTKTRKTLLDRPEDVQIAVFLETSPATESERQATAHTEPLSKYQGNHSQLN